MHEGCVFNVDVDGWISYQSYIIELQHTPPMIKVVIPRSCLPLQLQDCIMAALMLNISIL